MLALCLPCFVVSPLNAQSRSSSAASHLLLEDSERQVTEAAVRRGLEYLRRKQSNSGGVGDKFPVATTSLTGLAILGAGYQPSAAPVDRLTVDKDSRSSMEEMLEGCYSYIKRSSTGSGYITERGKPESRMHGHCYAILFLTQLAGSLPVEIEKEAAGLIKRGVLVVEKAQSKEGGWWYGPVNVSNKDEASVTICALQALRAANNTGFLVDSQRVESAQKYIKKCQQPDGSVRYSFSDRQNRTTFTLTAAAVSTLNAAGVYESPELRLGLDYLLKEIERHKNPIRAVEEEWFFYGSLYASQAFFQHGGETWRGWYPKLRQHLLKRQSPEGFWESRFGNEYATAVALLILELPLGYLPIFQR